MNYAFTLLVEDAQSRGMPLLDAMAHVREFTSKKPVPARVSPGARNRDAVAGLLGGLRGVA